jgi:hypothetical protein
MKSHKASTSQSSAGKHKFVSVEGDSDDEHGGCDGLGSRDSNKKCQKRKDDVIMCKTQLSKSNYLQRSVEKRDKQDCEWLPTVQQEDSSDDSQIAVRKRRGVKRP